MWCPVIFFRKIIGGKLKTIHKNKFRLDVDTIRVKNAGFNIETELLEFREGGSQRYIALIRIGDSSLLSQIDLPQEGYREAYNALVENLQKRKYDIEVTPNGSVDIIPREI